MSSGVIFKLKIHQNASAATGELECSPRSLWCQGAACFAAGDGRKEKGGREGEKREREGGKEAFPKHLFFTI